jgi:hypothetical protein
VSEFHIYFNNATANESAVVKAKAVAGEEITSWDVKLYGIPLGKQGQEVTINFKTFNVSHHNVFYTDSNALEMQERIIDFRPTWNFTTDEHVSGNYYPINQAIAIFDPTTKIQFTVMNDRSQGGSVI